MPQDLEINWPCHSLLFVSEHFLWWNPLMPGTFPYVYPRRCNVCKWKYKFSHVNRAAEVAIRLSVPLWPIVLIALSAAGEGYNRATPGLSPNKKLNVLIVPRLCSFWFHSPLWAVRGKFRHPHAQWPRCSGSLISSRHSLGIQLAGLYCNRC